MTVWTDLNTTEFCLTYVDAGGIRTRALQAGTGEPLLFLHGTTGHLDTFSRNIPSHAEHFAVHVIDMLGHGFSDKPDYPYTIPRYVEHVLAYLDAIGAPRAHLAGQSLGGWVACWLAAEHPDRVGKLSLLAPGGTVANPQIMEKIRTSTLAAAENSDPEYTRRRLEWLMADPATSVTDELVALRHAIYQQPSMRESVHNVLVLQDMEVRTKFLLTAERLGRIQAETYLLWTSENPTGDVTEGKFWEDSIPNCRFEILDDAGHWPQYEQAERFNKMHLDFLLN
jgi:2-hydroxy-6-oxonona-2,4-dienedioate hydrolase